MKSKNALGFYLLLILAVFALCGCGNNNYINQTSKYTLDMQPFSARGMLNCANKIMCYENKIYSLGHEGEANYILSAEFDENGIKENSESTFPSTEKSQFNIWDFDIDIQGNVYLLCQKAGEVFIVKNETGSEEFKEILIEGISDKTSYTIPDIKVDKNENIFIYYNQTLHIYNAEFEEVASMIIMEGEIFKNQGEIYAIVTDEKFKIKQYDFENNALKDVYTLINKFVSTDMFCYNEVLGLTFFDGYNLCSIDLESKNTYKYFNLSKLKEKKYFIRTHCFLTDDTMLLLLTKDGASGYYTVKFTNRE